MSDLFEQLLADTKPRVAEARICVDGELFLRLQELQRVIIEEDQTGNGDLAASAANELEDVLEQAEGRTYEFRCQAIGGAAWRKLKDEHAPSKAKIKEARDKGLRPPTFTDDFWPAAVAASLVAVRKADGDWEDVDWSVEQVEQLTRTWNEAQLNELYAVARIANEAGDALPKRGSAFARALTSSARSGSPETSDGLDRSSMAGD